MLVIVDKRKELPQDGRTILADAVVLEFIVDPRPQVLSLIHISEPTRPAA